MKLENKGSTPSIGDYMRLGAIEDISQRLHNYANKALWPDTMDKALAKVHDDMGIRQAEVKHWCPYCTTYYTGEHTCPPVQLKVGDSTRYNDMDPGRVQNCYSSGLTHVPNDVHSTLIAVSKTVNLTRHNVGDPPEGRKVA